MARVDYHRGSPPAYHGGAFEINVKRHDTHDWPDVPGATDAHTEVAWEILSEDWWQNIVPDIAEEYGFNPDHLCSAGRSDGWLIHRMRGPFEYLEDYGWDDLPADPDWGSWTERIEGFAEAIVASMPEVDEWTDTVERLRDDDTLKSLSSGRVCRSCGAIS